jgi:phosphoribosyl-ATP pyrophosphohydrolase
MKNSLTPYAKKELQVIYGKSKRLNRLFKKDHARVLLEMMEEHVQEIQERHGKGDKHYLIETGDLIVLCLELIKHAKQPPDTVLFKCYPRFHNKISQLIKDVKSRPCG